MLLRERSSLSSSLIWGMCKPWVVRKLFSEERLKSSSEKDPSTVGSETSSDGDPPMYICLNFPSNGCMLKASRFDIGE